MTAEIEFPQVRQEILAAVDALAEPFAPDPAIREKLPGVDSEFGEIFALLCESVDLTEDPSSAIGTFLLSEDEAGALNELAKLLERVWDETERYAVDPPYPTDDEFQRAATWPIVVESARRAQSVLAR